MQGEKAVGLAGQPPIPLRPEGRSPPEDFGGQVFKLYVPLEAYGRTAEALGALTAGALIGVQGKLAWRKREGEDKGSLVVMAQRLSALLSLAAAV